MYNDPQGPNPQPQPNPQWNGNGSANNTPNVYPPPHQNPPSQWTGDGVPNPQFDPNAFITQMVPSQGQWAPGNSGLPQGSYPPPVQNPASQTQWANDASNTQFDPNSSITQMVPSQDSWAGNPSLPQGAYSPPVQNPASWANGNPNPPQDAYAPPVQNPAPQAQWANASPPQGAYAPPVQNPAPQAQWANANVNSPQGYFPQNQPSQGGIPQPNPSSRGGLISSRSVKKSNLPMIAIGGVTALVVIMSLVLFINFSNHPQPSTPVVQTNTATPEATPDMTTPTPEATATPIPTPTVVPTPTTVVNTAPPPPVVQQAAPTPIPTAIAKPTPKPTVAPAATPTVDPETFSYDTNSKNGTLVTNPPADFCSNGHEGPNAGLTCVPDFFTNAGGYVVTCKDKIHVVHDGGETGACNNTKYKYGGEGKKWYKHPLK